jgi:hypothetical protein
MFEFRRRPRDKLDLTGARLAARTSMFNTLKYAKILEEVGFSREQAETSIKILVEVMEDKLASKQDLKDLESRMEQRFIGTSQDIKDLESRMEQRFQDVHSKFALLESKLTIKMGTMLAASIAILTAIQKLV